MGKKPSKTAPATVETAAATETQLQEETMTETAATVETATVEATSETAPEHAYIEAQLETAATHAPQMTPAEIKKAERKAEREKAAEERKKANDARKAALEAKKAKADEEKADKAEKTRAGVFNKIVTENAPMTKKDIAGQMAVLYGGSTAEANFQTDLFVRLLVTMGHMKKQADGTLLYTPPVATTETPAEDTPEATPEATVETAAAE